MKFAELEPTFLRHKTEVQTWTRVTDDAADPARDADGKFIHTEQVTGPRQIHYDVDTMSEAMGVMFLCPKCSAHGGSAGSHYVVCWFRDRGVPDDAVPGPARWAASGTGLDDLTLSPSVLLTSGCAWHGFVTAGEVSTC